MPAILLTGAAGQGKTRDAIAQVRASIRRNPFGTVWVLLPTDLQISAFRARLLDELDDGAYFGVEFFDFYSLYARLLESMGIPQRRVQDAARFRILRHVIDQVRDDLDHFSRIAQAPGFVALVADFIQELKQARINPDDFKQAIRTPKDRELWLIYAAYQAFLRQRDLVDGEGEGWLALARLESTPDVAFDVDLLIVDGYDQFNPVQAQLLAQLAKRLRHMFLTLTYQPERANTAHRRFAQTRERLLDAMAGAGGRWDEKPLGAQREVHPSNRPPGLSQPVMNGQNCPGGRPPTLDYLSGKLFDTRPVQIGGDGALAMVEAPDRRCEAQTVLRRVKRLLLSGVKPEQIAIVARSLEPYMPYFLEAALAYGVPLTNRRGSPLAENPAIAAFLSLLALPEGDFPRRATIDALRSPYLKAPDLSAAQIDALDRISRAQVVIGGQRNWLAAIDAAAHRQSDEEGEPVSDTFSPEDAALLRTAVESFFARITPPAEATPRECVRWLESLIGPDAANIDEIDEGETPPPTGHFRLIERIRAGTEPGIVARDLAAMDCLKRIFRDVLSAYELIDAWTPVPWENIRLDLRIAIDNARSNVPRGTNRLGRVLLASVFEARGLPHDHIFLIGLSEGELPAHAPEDALYVDSERRQMQEQGLPLLTRTEAADESSLFYEITALAQRTLTLVRPYVDDKGNEWPASPYWRAARSLVEAHPERLPIASAVALDDAASQPEVLVALAQSLNGEPTETILGAHRWLIAQAELAARWANARRCRHIEILRASRNVPHDAYTGRLSDPALLDVVRDTLGPDRVWSASQFNEYGKCPFQFFARRLLQLEALKEPEEGLDRFQHGLLMHEILEHTYRQIAAEKLAITAENQARALDILDQTFDRLVSDAPQRYGFRASAMWEQEQTVLRRKLRALVKIDFSAGSPVGTLLPGVRHAHRQEVRFGPELRHTAALEGLDGAAIRLRGAIDRVDIADGRIVVIDYKSGSSRFSADDLIAGRNVQMMLYVLAAGQVLAGSNQNVIGGAFWHIPTNELSGTVQADKDEDREALDEAYRNLLDRIERGRAGVFVNRPSKMVSGRCAHECEYRQLCRVDRVSMQKAIQPSSA